MKLSGHDERRICVQGRVDPRTLKKYLAGETVRPMVRERIEEALATTGFGVLVRRPLARAGAKA